ncbi:LOW QUALITY PROTEIN: CUE domain-containing protein 2-like [Balaenoptera ricei]|uniref:LOW QUALITY PROTEIN: CUE domain-containing protein 2-like n=1 Tax=Balaenoptera ricei TaxID=2746895 RepID=UPI0028BD59C5|nr:LOW QUALITY PROTEIN: CUE domain-containing protein 2-like [Balaenoptera ricei]
MELERGVCAALLTFVQTHLPEADLSSWDEVIFCVLGVLEDLGPSGPSEENFDMEAFTEMMEAYVPSFSHIPRGTRGEMMQRLSGQLSGARNKENLQPQNSEVQGQVSIAPEPLQRFKEETMSSPTAARDTQEEASGAEEELLPGVDVLLEVFLPCSVEQAQWVLARARGDLEEAVQMLVEGKEERPPAWDGPNQDLPRRLRGPQKDELKSFILQKKYMMVDSAEDQKIRRPMAPKEAPKKLIQCIDNQVASTEGERFKDVRDPEAEEMKATYVSLKPARKYRFHGGTRQPLPEPSEEQKFLSSGNAPRCCSRQCDADHHKSQARQQDPEKQTQASCHGGVPRGRAALAVQVPSPRPCEPDLRLRRAGLTPAPAGACWLPHQRWCRSSVPGAVRPWERVPLT